MSWVARGKWVDLLPSSAHRRAVRGEGVLRSMRCGSGRRRPSPRRRTDRRCACGVVRVLVSRLVCRTGCRPMAVVTSGVGLRQWRQRQLFNGSMRLNGGSQSFDQANAAWRRRAGEFGRYPDGRCVRWKSCRGGREIVGARRRISSMMQDANDDARPEANALRRQTPKKS